MSRGFIGSNSTITSLYGEMELEVEIAPPRQKKRNKGFKIKP